MSLARGFEFYQNERGAADRRERGARIQRGPDFISPSLLRFGWAESPFECAGPFPPELDAAKAGERRENKCGSERFAHLTGSV